MTKSNLLGVLFAAPLLAPAAELRSVTVVAVTDGATIAVRDGTSKYRVRLAAIGAPEKGQQFAKGAGEHLPRPLDGRRRLRQLFNYF